MTHIDDLSQALEHVWNRFEEHGTSENTKTRVALIRADTELEIASHLEYITNQLTRIADALEKANQLQILGPDPEL